ncbi:MAG: HEAT repeat domain-containing protein [Planctomycetes bacterium]|nr:HEAT repeat domain-containing protein [Planctomycetota bacterium]
MIATSAGDRAECAYLLRAEHTMDTRPSIRSIDAGSVKVTVTVTVFKQEIENPGAPRDKLVIQEKKLFTIAEEGRKMTSLKGAVSDASSPKAFLVMEVAAAANAVEFIQSKLAAKLRQLMGMEKIVAPVASQKTRLIAGRLRTTASDSQRRKYAAELVAIGKDAVPALIDLLKDPSPKVRICAATALGEIGDVSALHVLRKLDDKARRREEGQDVGEAAREAAKKIYQKNK